MQHTNIQIEEKPESRRETWSCVLFGICLFSFLLLFFGKLHPLMMHDGDDWGYSSYTRTLLPIWGGWNPTRVLPELISPLIAYAAAYLVMPFIGDLSWAMAWTYALFFSAVITVYVLIFVRFVRLRFSLSHGRALCLGALFFVSHFLVLRSDVRGNVHMFYCWNVNTYFFYLLPDLLCASLALYFLAQKNRLYTICWNRPIETGCMFVLLYLAVFSNMFSNYIVAVFSGLMLLSRLLHALRDKRSIASVIRDNGWLVVVLVLWVVCAVFELSGGRAENLSTDTPFIDRLKAVYAGLLDVIGRLNLLFTVVCLTAIAAAMVTWIRSRMKQGSDVVFGQTLILLIAAFLLSGCYLVLLAAKANPPYIQRPDVIFGAMFMMLMLVMCALAYLCQRLGWCAALLPIIFMVFVFETDTRWSTFKESNVSGLSVYECAAVNQALIDQIIAADERGESYPQIEVPSGPYWYISDSIAVTLLKCGMIENEVYAHNLTIDNFYEKYNIK